MPSTPAALRLISDLPPNNIAKPKKKQSNFTGNFIFFVFLTAWSCGLYQACAAHWNDGSPWPAAYDWENKLFKIAHGDFSFDDFFNGEAVTAPIPMTLADARAWLDSHIMIPTVGTVTYLTMLVLGPMIMSSKSRPFWHKPLLTLWSLGLAVFSTLGAFRVVPTVLKSVIDEGYHVFICGPSEVNPTDMDGNRLDALAASFKVQRHREEEWSPYFFLWVYMFILSKVPELVDTFFIIVGKGNVRFLHWYHHVTVLWYTWNLAFLEMSTSAFAAMNLCVHSIMYAWYALAAADGFLASGLKARKFAMMVTSIQILQMFAGNFVTVYQVMNPYNMESEKPCVTVPSVGNFGAVMYGSYLVLFIKLFVNAYVCPPKRSKKKTA